MNVISMRLHGVRLGSLIGLGAKIGRGRATLREVAREYWLDERAEDHLCAAEV